MCGDEGDAECGEGPAELHGLALASKFFFQGPMVIVAHEDAVAITVEGDGDAEAAKQALEQVEIARGSFRWEEFGRQDFVGSVVLKTEGGKQRAAA